MVVYISVRRQRSQGGLSDTISPPRTSSAQGPGRSYTEEQVAAHNRAEDLWLIIRGKVYDFTEYIAHHPGGEAMLKNAGRDSTEGFSGTQHPARVWDMVRFATLPTT